MQVWPACILFIVPMLATVARRRRKRKRDCDFVCWWGKARGSRPSFSWRRLIGVLPHGRDAGSRNLAAVSNNDTDNGQPTGFRCQAAADRNLANFRLGYDSDYSSKSEGLSEGPHPARRTCYRGHLLLSHMTVATKEGRRGNGGRPASHVGRTQTFRFEQTKVPTYRNGK